MCRFSRERRLRRAVQFQRLYTSGRRVGNVYFSAVVQPNELGSARLGLSVAARTLKRAVARNRIRRLIRESFRLRHPSLPALDIIIGVRGTVLGADNAQMRESLEKLWQKISSSCVQSSFS